MKFCKNCGKQVAVGQTCDCAQGAASPPSPHGTHPASGAGATPPHALHHVTPPAPPTPAPYAPAPRTPHASPYPGGTPTVSSVASNVASRFTGANDYDLGGDPYERGLKIVPDCVVPNDGEIPVRQYTIATLSKSMFSTFEGRLQVTNQRVLFRASGRTILGRFYNHSEFAIDEIAGFDAMRDKSFNWFKFILGAIISLAIGFLGYWFSSGWDPSPVLGNFLILLAFIVIILAVIKNINNNLSINIRSKGSQAVISIPLEVNDITSFVQMMMTSAVMAGPAVDTETAIRELGAIVNDIQKLGDHGVSKWL